MLQFVVSPLFSHIHCSGSCTAYRRDPRPKGFGSKIIWNITTRYKTSIHFHFIFPWLVKVPGHFWRVKSSDFSLSLEGRSTCDHFCSHEPLGIKTVGLVREHWETFASCAHISSLSSWDLSGALTQMQKLENLY